MTPGRRATDMGANRYRVPPGNPFYRRAVAREAKWWGRSELAQRRRAPREHPLIVAYGNRCVSGCERTSWEQVVRARYGELRQACSLGAGIGYVEEGLLEGGLFERLDVYELSQQASEKFRARLVAKGLDGRVGLHQSDVNFAQLPGERYDAVLCNTILHHVVNLEHVAAQVNRSLRPDGVLIVYDFVGEPRFQWEEEKVRQVNAVLRDLPLAYGLVRLARPDRLTLTRRTPFEAIRSDETLAVLERYLEPELIKTFEPLLTPLAMRLLQEFDWEDEHVCRALDRGCDADQRAMSEGRLRPCRAFALYRKRDDACEPDVQPWTEAEIRDRLAFRSGPQEWLHRKLAALRGAPI